MRELILIAVSVFLTTFVNGQAPSIADLESAAHIESSKILSEPVLLFSALDYLPTTINEVRHKDALKFPLQIKDVPTTAYWMDKLEDKIDSNEVEVVADNKIVSTTTSTTSTTILNKKLLQFNPLKRKLLTSSLASIKSNGLYNLPFAIQQVNRTVYVTEKVEAHYAMVKQKEMLAAKEVESNEAVINRLEKETVAVNAKTSKVNSRGEIINKKELKSIVRRARGKKAKYVHTEEVEKEDFEISASLSAHPKTTSENKLVETKVATSFHKQEAIPESINTATTSIAPKYDTEVVNRELAVLEKMIKDSDSPETSMATSTTVDSNVHIPAMAQPLEVTSEVINGASVITEIKPAYSNSNTTSGENRTIKAEQFSLQTIDNELININQMKGKVVVLNFWFTSCVECIREIPHLNELKNRYQGQEIEFVGICLNDKTKIKSFLQKHPFDWKQIPNARKVAHDYYMFIYPGHAVVDKDGGLITLLNGNAPGVMQQLETAIQVGLGETY